MSHQDYCVTCSKPLKKGEKLFSVAAARRGEDTIRALYVCGQCAPHYEKITYLYEFLDGRTYRDANAPSWWEHCQTIIHYETRSITYAERCFIQNPENSGRLDQKLAEQVLAESAIDTSQLPPLVDFPLIEDFDIVLMRFKKSNIPGDQFGTYDLRFFSPSRSYLARTLYSPIKSTYSFRFEGAFGTLYLPYYDFDQAYKLLIFEDEMFVYVLEGGDWQNDEYYRWFKADKQRYYERWKNIIQLATDVPTDS